jgi:hypothetical protein
MSKWWSRSNTQGLNSCPKWFAGSNPAFDTYGTIA